jgi:hypothetical protein
MHATRQTLAADSQSCFNVPKRYCILSVALYIRLSIFPSHNRGVGRGAPSGNRPQHRSSWDGVPPNQPPRGGEHIIATLMVHSQTAASHATELAPWQLLKQPDETVTVARETTMTGAVAAATATMRSYLTDGAWFRSVKLQTHVERLQSLQRVSMVAAVPRRLVLPFQ